MTGRDYVDANTTDLFLKLSDANLIPEYVYDSEIITSDVTKQLKDIAFADPKTRSYPCFSKAACWMSAAWAAGRLEEDEEVKENIVKMAKIHHIEDDVEGLFNYFNSEFNKVASVNEEPDTEKEYALKIASSIDDSSNNEVLELYPINNDLEIIDSGEKVAKAYNFGKLSPSVMRDVSYNILKQAAANHIDNDMLPTIIIQFGERRMPDPFSAEFLLGDMRKQAAVADYLCLLADLAEYMTKKASSPENAVDYAEKIAGQIYDLDQKNNVVYNTWSPDPCTLIFTGPTMDILSKAASTNFFLDNIRIPTVDLVNISDENINNMFSEKSASIINDARNTAQLEATEANSNYITNKLDSLDDVSKDVLKQLLVNAAW